MFTVDLIELLPFKPFSQWHRKITGGKTLPPAKAAAAGAPRAVPTEVPASSSDGISAPSAKAHAPSLSSAVEQEALKCQTTQSGCGYPTSPSHPKKVPLLCQGSFQFGAVKGREVFGFG